MPYDSAHRGERMGAGPEALIDGGLRALLEERGHDVDCTLLEAPAESWRAEIRTAFELAAALASAVRNSRAEGRFPLVLAGNCGAALGVVAALGGGTPVLWADAHGDFNTPDTTVGGFLDGMALATLTGRCWARMAEQIPGFAPVREDRVWLLGARDLDPLEADALSASSIRRVAADAVGREAGEGIARDIERASRPYLHIDLDVLDTSEGRANRYAVAGGVSTDGLAAFCGSLGRHAPPAALTLSAYDPAEDRDGRIRLAAIRVVAALLEALEDAPGEKNHPFG